MPRKQLGPMTPNRRRILARLREGDANRLQLGVAVGHGDASATAGKMQEFGWIEMQDVGGGRVYRITPAGLAALEQVERKDPWPVEVREPRRPGPAASVPITEEQAERWRREAAAIDGEFYVSRIELADRCRRVRLGLPLDGDDEPGEPWGPERYYRGSGEAFGSNPMLRGMPTCVVRRNGKIMHRRRA